MADTGIPVAFQVAETSENQKLYGALVNKGVAPPLLRRAVWEEKYGDQTGDTWSTFAQRSGAMLKSSTLANLGMISRQSPGDAKKTLSGFAATADRIAAKGLGLEPVAGASASAGTSGVPAASAASGGLLGGGAGLLGGAGAAAGGLLGGGAARRTGGAVSRTLRTGRMRLAGMGRRLGLGRLRTGLRRLASKVSRRRHLIAAIRRPQMRRLRLAV